MHFIDRPIYIDEYIFRGEGSAMTDTWGKRCRTAAAQENQFNMHFTELPQDLVPQKRKENDYIYMKKCSFLFYFAFVVFCILYKADSL